MKKSRVRSEKMRVSATFVQVSSMHSTSPEYTQQLTS